MEVPLSLQGATATKQSIQPSPGLGSGAADSRNRAKTRGAEVSWIATARGAGLAMTGQEA